MRILKMRERLPDRRRSWTVGTVIQGHPIELGFGEQEDGKLGEVWIDMSKQGTFAQRIMGKFARMMSISLQCGASPEMLVYSLREEEPEEKIDGSTSIDLADEIGDWIASQIEQYYCVPQDVAAPQEVAQGDPIPEKVAGYIPETWRVGA